MHENDQEKPWRKMFAQFFAVKYMFHKWMTVRIVTLCTHLYPKRTVGNGIASEEHIDGMDSQLGGHVVAPVHRDKNFIFLRKFCRKMCLRSHISYQIDRPKRGDWNAISCATLQGVLQKRPKIPRRNYITKLIRRTLFCRIPFVERGK
jgi:hypothetical protein